MFYFLDSKPLGVARENKVRCTHPRASTRWADLQYLCGRTHCNCDALYTILYYTVLYYTVLSCTILYTMLNTLYIGWSCFTVTHCIGERVRFLELASNCISSLLWWWGELLCTATEVAESSCFQLWNFVCSKIRWYDEPNQTSLLSSAAVIWPLNSTS